uniref:ACT domain-containing protein n=1 Tax=Acyrthosiphon pisum TaxID=7029 RepID=A0A8R2HC04_ACYPI
MPVEWDKVIDQEFVAEIKVDMFNHQGALANLTAAINTAGSNIQSLNTEERDGRVYSAFIRLTANDRVHLANIMRKIRVMPDEMLAMRQHDLTVCMEQVHKPHNVSAVIRTADAVGIHEVHAVWPSVRMRTMVSASAGSNSWVKVQTHRHIAEAVRHLKDQGMQVLATNLSANA